MKLKKMMTSLAQATYTNGLLLALFMHIGVFFLLRSSTPPQSEGPISEEKKTVLIPMQMGSNEKVNHHGLVQKTNQSSSTHSDTVQMAGNELPGAETTGAPGSREEKNTFESAIVHYEEPIYPILARRKGIEGTVVLAMTINAHEGTVLDYTITKSSGTSLLDEAVKSAVSRWRFRPSSDQATYQLEKTFIFKIK